ncbi:MAG: class I SAM-dependent methyltransferase [SAR202 cluster bacterium]|jgi:ubiquinone/menaquinone biosynthesis C-methylase UbiE|nr:class I SAM-dependent methyltransferase [SAR202 cluster bacterium]MDP6513709.1 class I SAM-dependent methyltransferase [SAR202 cluster bacterium]MDP6715217.1 class I SAM-dependent methyltransferase [SAR202 cluster bacterium]
MTQHDYERLGYNGLSKRLFAAGYDLLNAGVENRVIPYRRLTAGLADGRVLEVGGGTGANLKFYPPGVDLTFVEPNPHMAHRLQRNARQLGMSVNVSPGFGEDLPFDDASFDTAVTTLVLCMVSDVERVVTEIRRVLKPGGRFLFYEHVVSSHSKIKAWQGLLNPFWKFATTGCNLNRDLSGEIELAGFSNVELRRFSLSVGLPITIPNIVGVAIA